MDDDTRRTWALTWTTKEVRVSCPYKCITSIHVYLYDAKTEHSPLSRILPCPNLGNETFRYRRCLIGFPPETPRPDLWREYDAGKLCYRTRGWSLELQDPLYDEDDSNEAPVPLSHSTSASVDDLLADSFGGLRVGENPNVEVSCLESFREACIEGDATGAKQLFIEAGSPRAWLSSIDELTDEKLLTTVCSRGHLEVVRLLQTLGVDMHLTEPSAQNPLSAALQSLQVHVAREILLSDAIRRLSASQAREFALQSIRVLHRFTKHHLGKGRRSQRAANKEAMGHDAIYTALLRIVKRLIVQCQAAEAKRQASQCDQAFQRLVWNRLMETPKENTSKAVACLTTGYAMPLVSSTSGYTICRVASPITILDRILATDRVFMLADHVGFSLSQHYYDGLRTGSFWACHAEKQLLAWYLWRHTSVLDYCMQASKTRRRWSAWESMVKVVPIIYVYQEKDHNEPDSIYTRICPDCQTFFDVVAQILQLTITLVAVHKDRTSSSMSWQQGKLVFDDISGGALPVLI